METWKDIAGYEGLYQISSYGNVRGVDRICNGVRVRGQAKKVMAAQDGYMITNLIRGGKNKRCYVHRLVAEAFIDNSDNKPEVNHKDGNKSNNNVSNLEWVTSDENIEHAYKHGLIKRKRVIMDDSIEFDSITKCARYVGVDKHEIRRALRGEYKTVHGHTFRLA